MLNETDKQVGEILAKLQDVTPEVAEQAVTYGQLFSGIGLGIFATLCLAGLITMLVGIFKQKGADYGCDGWGFCAALAGAVAIIAGFLCLPFAAIWLKAVFAPDYYSAECIMQLIK